MMVSNLGKVMADNLDITTGVYVEGNVSGNIAGRDINIQYGVPQKVVDRLLKELDDKDVKLQEREAVIASWIQKYNELESQLSSRTDDTAKQATTFLNEGKLEDAEKLFKQSLANKLTIVKEAAAEAFYLAQIKYLQLDYSEARNYYQQAVQLDPENAIYLNNLGASLCALGKYAEAEPLYLRSLEIDEKNLGKDHFDIIWNLNNLATAYYGQAKYAQAESLFLRCLAIEEKNLGKDQHQVRIITNLASLYHDQGKYEQAEPLYLQSLAISENILGKDHPEVARCLNNLGGLYEAQGNYLEAEPFLKRSLDISEKILREDHPDIARSLNSLAICYEGQGNYDQAIDLYLRCLAIREKILGKDHPDVANVLNNLGDLYRKQGNYIEAESLLQRSLDISENSLGQEHPDVAMSLSNLILCYFDQGKYAEAESLFLRIDSLSAVPELVRLATIFQSQGKSSQAEPLLIHSLAILEKMLGENHPRVATSLNNLAMFYCVQGKNSEAKPLFQRSLAILEKTLGKDHPTTKLIRENYEITLGNKRSYRPRLRFIFLAFFLLLLILVIGLI